jgi:hypothetical protein
MPEDMPVPFFIADKKKYEHAFWDCRLWCNFVTVPNRDNMQMYGEMVLKLHDF